MSLDQNALLDPNKLHQISSKLAGALKKIEETHPEAKKELESFHMMCVSIDTLGCLLNNDVHRWLKYWSEEYQIDLSEFEF